MEIDRHRDHVLGVLDREGATAGTSFLAGPPGHVVTCAHVLADAGYAPGDEVTLRRGADSLVSARVLPDWAAPNHEDVACLELVDTTVHPGLGFETVSP